MAFYKIMSDEALEKLVCSNCYNYLSYGQAKIGSEKIICGRCNQEDGTLPLFDKNIENYLFPCINRFDNCKELLHYSQVATHEKICKNGTKHECPECKFAGNGCQLYHHFIRLHSNHVLKKSDFNIDLLNSKLWNYLYRINNNLFLVTCQTVRTGKSILKLSVKSISHTDEDMPLCKIVLTSSKTESQYLVSEIKNVLEVEYDVFKHIKQHKEILITCHLNVKVGSELFTLKKTTLQSQTSQKRLPMRRYGSQSMPPPKDETKTIQRGENHDYKQLINALNKNLLPKLRCGNCGCYVVPPIYRCPQNHAQCEGCHNSFCNACDDIVNLSKATDLEMFHDVIPLPCRWKCKNLVMSSELRTHEKNCSDRRYKCVEEWCSWSGSLDALVQHWHSSSPIYNDTHETYGFHENFMEFYLAFNREVFLCRMNALKSNGRNIHIRKISEVTPSSEKYSAKVLLTHKCDEVLRENAVDIKLGGISLLERRLFDYFGQCKNYKIIFSILINS